MMRLSRDENPQLAIPDSALKCCRAYLTSIFREFEEAAITPSSDDLLNMQEMSMMTSSYFDKNEIGLIRPYIEILTERSQSQLPQKMLVRIEEYLRQNIRKIVEDYDEQMKRIPSVLEMLVIFITALKSFENKLADPAALELLQAKIRSDAAVIVYN